MTQVGFQDEVTRPTILIQAQDGDLFALFAAKKFCWNSTLCIDLSKAGSQSANPRLRGHASKDVVRSQTAKLQDCRSNGQLAI